MNTNEAYRRGMSAYNAGRYAEAVRFLELLPNQPGLPGLLGRFYLGQVHHQLGLEHFHKREFRHAAAHFQSAARFNPLGGGVERLLAACYAKTGRLDLAADQLQGLLDAQPDDVETRIRLALAMWKTSRQAQAIEVLAAGLARHPEHAELAYQLGVMYAATERYAAAIEHLERAIKHDPEHVGAHERLAQCCSVVGDHTRCQELLQRAHALEPRDPRIALQLSLLAPSCKTNRMLTLARKPAGEPDLLDASAMERLGELIAREPDFVTAFLSLPVSVMDHEVFSMLAATVERALESRPEYADLHYHCGQVYRRLGRSARAIEYAERAVRINPRFVNALVLLAELYAETDQIEDGVRRLEQAISNGGDYADVHYTLGRLYQRTGRTDRARGAFKRSLDLNSNYQPARDALVSLQEANS